MTPKPELITVETLHESLTHLETNIKAIVELREKVDTLEAQGKGFADYKENLDKAVDGLTEGIAEHKKLTTVQQEQIDGFDVQLQRIGETDGGKVEPELWDLKPDHFRSIVRTADSNPALKQFVNNKQHREMFLAYLRSGEVKPPELREYMESLEVRALTEGTDTEGGYLVPAEYEAEIQKTITEINFFRPHCRVTTISGKSLEFPKRTDSPTAYRSGEEGTGTESSSTYGMEELFAYALTVKTNATMDFLMDAAVNAEAEILSDAGEAMAYKEGTEFVSGVLAQEEFEGITLASGMTTVTSGSSNVIDEDDFSKLYVAVKSPYAASGTYFFNRNSLGKILLLKETGGPYYWQPSQLQLGVPTAIYGRPYALIEGLDNEGDDKYPIFFGDWKKGYRIVDRIGIELQRDPFSSWPIQVFKFRKRSGGRVVQAEALAKLNTT